MIKGDPSPRSTFPLALWWPPPRCLLIVWVLGRVVSLPPLYVIYSELNRHGISRKRENAECLRGGMVLCKEALPVNPPHALPSTLWLCPCCSSLRGGTQTQLPKAIHLSVLPHRGCGPAPRPKRGSYPLLSASICGCAAQLPTISTPFTGMPPNSSF